MPRSLLTWLACVLLVSGVGALASAAASSRLPLASLQEHVSAGIHRGAPGMTNLLDARTRVEKSKVESESCGNSLGTHLAAFLVAAPKSTNQGSDAHRASALCMSRSRVRAVPCHALRDHRQSALMAAAQDATSTDAPQQEKQKQQQQQPLHTSASDGFLKAKRRAAVRSMTTALAAGAASMARAPEAAAAGAAAVEYDKEREEDEKAEGRRRSALIALVLLIGGGGGGVAFNQASPSPPPTDWMQRLAQGKALLLREQIQELDSLLKEVQGGEGGRQAAEVLEACSVLAKARDDVVSKLNEARQMLKSGEVLLLSGELDAAAASGSAAFALFQNAAARGGPDQSMQAEELLERIRNARNASSERNRSELLAAAAAKARAAVEEEIRRGLAALKTGDVGGARGRAASAADILEQFRREGAGALALRWKEAGSDKPLTGSELKNELLAAALQKKLDFSKEEWDKFKVAAGAVSTDSYIKSGSRYCKPAAAGAEEADGTFYLQTKVDDFGARVERVEKLYAAAAAAFARAGGQLTSVKECTEAREACEESLRGFDKASAEGGADKTTPVRARLEEIRKRLEELDRAQTEAEAAARRKAEEEDEKRRREEENAAAASKRKAQLDAFQLATRRAQEQEEARRKAEEDGKRMKDATILTKYGVDDKLFTNFAFGTEGAGMQIETQRLVLRRLDRTLPLEFRAGFVTPEIPLSGSSYIEVEVEEGGLACMVGVTTSCELDTEGRPEGVETWTVSLLDGSLWHNDLEVTSTADESAAPERDSGYKGFSLFRSTLAAVWRTLNPLEGSRMRRLGYSSRRGGGKGDRIGLLVNRSEGSMQVFVNGVLHPTAFTSIPGAGGALFFMAELLSDPQSVRIVQNASPPSIRS